MANYLESDQPLTNHRSGRMDINVGRCRVRTCSEATKAEEGAKEKRKDRCETSFVAVHHY